MSPRQFDGNPLMLLHRIPSGVFDLDNMRKQNKFVTLPGVFLVVLLQPKKLHVAITCYEASQVVNEKTENTICIAMIPIRIERHLLSHVFPAADDSQHLLQ